MSIATLHAICALVGSIILLSNQDASRLLSALATITAAAEVAIALKLISLRVPGISLALILGVVLAVTGTIIYLKVRSKLAITAATIVAFVGIMQALIAMRIF